MLCALIPDPSTVAGLDVEEVALVILQGLNTLPPDNTFDPRSYAEASATQYASQHQKEIKHVVMEAMSWLVSHGMLADAPGGNAGWLFVTRRGRSINDRAALDAYKVANLLPREKLHPRLVHIYADFIRGDYDSAVFKAFKQVEVTVRDKGGYTSSDYGTDLMRKAFKSSAPVGSLTDPTLPIAELDAMSHLYAGAIGLFKNPGSHRIVEIKNVSRAIEMILFANLLIALIDPI